MTLPTENQAQIENWNGRSGDRWADYQEALNRTLQPHGALAMARGDLRPGERVLDVGCGCGGTTIELARRVGSSGHVLGVDVSKPMLARARLRAEATPAIELAEADAAEATLPPRDLVYSRFGVMFFADPVRAFRNLRATGGRLAFVCWQPLADNPWASLPGEAVAPFAVEEPPAPPDAPGPFAFGDRARVQGILEASGWTSISIEPARLPMRWTTTPDLDQAVEIFAHIGPASRRLGEAAPEQREAGLRALRAVLAAHMKADGVVFESAVWIVTAR